MRLNVPQLLKYSEIRERITHLEHSRSISSTHKENIYNMSKRNIDETSVQTVNSDVPLVDPQARQNHLPMLRVLIV
jgi:hypothetical protein